MLSLLLSIVACVIRMNQEQVKRRMDEPVEDDTDPILLYAGIGR